MPVIHHVPLLTKNNENPCHIHSLLVVAMEADCMFVRKSIDQLKNQQSDPESELEVLRQRLPYTQ